MADEKFDVFADKMMTLIRELRTENGQLNKEMQDTKKQSKGLLDFLTRQDSFFVKASKFATTAQKDASAQQRAFAQTWLAVRRISAKVSYDAYALQSTIVGAFDTAKAISETAAMFQNIQEKKTKKEVIAEKSKLEVLREQQEKIIEAREENLQAFVEKRKEMKETIKYLQEKSEYEKLSFEEHKMLLDLMEGTGGQMYAALQASYDKNAEGLTKRFLEISGEIGDEEQKNSKEKKNRNFFFEGYSILFKKINPRGIADALTNLGKMAASIFRLIGTLYIIGATLYLLQKGGDLYSLFVGIYEGIVYYFALFASTIDKYIIPGLVNLATGVSNIVYGLSDLFSAGSLEEVFLALYRILIDGIGSIAEGAMELFIGVIGLGINAVVGAVVAFGIAADSYVRAQMDQGINVVFAILQLVTIVGGIAAAIAIFFSVGFWAGIAVLIGTAIATGIQRLFGTLFTKAFAGEMANGGIAAKRGMYLVGERGPELVTLPAGARVYNNEETRSMSGNNITVNVQGRIGASDAELREIAQKIGRMVNMEVNRTTASRTRGI